MRRQGWSIILLIVVCTLALPGCSWFGGDEDSQLSDSDDVEFPEFDNRSSSESSMSPQKAVLQLNLEVGDRFPLIKTVRQELSQLTSEGQVNSFSELKMLLSINVDQVNNGRKLMRVVYQRVQYQHNIAGETVQFDSDTPKYPMPDIVKAYQGMVNNGFAFWVGSDNQVKDVLGFQEFLDRCVQNVPSISRKTLLSKLGASSSEDGIANFVDDSIGLLPNVRDDGAGKTVAVKIGDTWQRNRQILRPIPMYVTTTCTLSEVTERAAEVNITGKLTPASTIGPSDQPNSDVKLTIRGGQVYGECIIDRTTGLPIRSQIEKHIDMHVQLSASQQFEQRKRIVTVIESFPESTPTKFPTASRSSENGNIRQVNGTDNRFQERQRVRNAGGFNSN